MDELIQSVLPLRQSISPYQATDPTDRVSYLNFTDIAALAVRSAASLPKHQND